MPRPTMSRRNLSTSDLYPIVQDITDREEDYDRTDPSWVWESTRRTSNGARHHRHGELNRNDSNNDNASASSSSWSEGYKTTATSSATDRRFPFQDTTNKSPSVHHHPQQRRRLDGIQPTAKALRGHPMNGMVMSESFTTLSTVEEKLSPSFYDSYVLTRQIFRCTESDVWECVHRESGQRYCVKIMEPLRITEEGVLDLPEDQVWREVRFLQLAQSHPNIVELVDVMDDPAHTHMVMELMTGGNLLSRVVQQGGLPEPTVQQLARTLLEGVLHLHRTGICHNDLQPSNILLDSLDRPKIADFGHSTRVDSVSIYAMPSNKHYRRNMSYAAPEILLGVPATPSSDMWSIGVVIYFCLFGRPPFNDKNTGRPAASRIYRADYSFPTAAEYKSDEEVSRKGKQWISSLLHPDPTVRLTAEEALHHPWMTTGQLHPNMPTSDASGLPPDSLYASSTFSSCRGTYARAGLPNIRSLARRLVCRPFRRRYPNEKDTASPCATWRAMGTFQSKDPGYRWKSLKSNSTESSMACSSLLHDT